MVFICIRTDNRIAGGRKGENLRIAMVSRHPDPRDVRIYHKESRSLREAGHEVVVIQYLKGGKVPQMQEGDYDIRFRTVRGYGRSKVVEFWESTKGLAEAVCDERPDAIHCHDLETLPSGVEALKKREVPLILDAHEDFPNMAYQVNPVLGWLWMRIQNRFLPKVDKVITVSEIYARTFKGRDPLIVMNYPPLWFGELGSDRLRDVLSPNGEIVILYHGVLSDLRRPDVMFEVAKRITQKYDARFLFLGRTFDNIQIPKTQRIEHLGYVPWLRVPDFLRATDIGFCAINPTERYKQGITTKLYECMLFGKPFVANEEFPMVMTLLEEVPCGTSSPYDVDLLVSKLSMLIEDDVLRKTLGTRGRQAVEDRYNWEREAKKLVDFYNSLDSIRTIGRG